MKAILYRDFFTLKNNPLSFISLLVVCVVFPFFWNGTFLPISSFSPLRGMTTTLIIMFILVLLPSFACMSFSGHSYTIDKEDNMIEIYVQSGKNMFIYFLYKSISPLVLSLFLIGTSLITCVYAFPEVGTFFTSSFGFVLGIIGLISAITTTQIIALFAVVFRKFENAILISMLTIAAINYLIIRFINAQARPIVTILTYALLIVCLAMINSHIVKQKFRNNIK
jgi:hypothetical protein